MNIIYAFTQLIPDHSLPEFSISIVICISLAIFAYWRGILDASGSAASFIVGIVIAIFGNIYWLITLICFLIVTFMVTKFNFNYKRSQGVAQGKHGERNAKNVFANGLIPAIIPVFRYWLGDPLAGFLFIVAISEAASDSFANEIGVLSNRTYLITNLKKRVRPGIDGGVSVLGECAGLVGAFIPALLGWILMSEFNHNLISVTNSPQMPMTTVTLLIPLLIGFLGCHIDSILGATLQRRKLISNDAVNFLSVSISVIIGLGMALFMVI
ncbi:DUF92 domain-containing protein [[Eubacterium] cellulosolvens]